MTPSCIPPRVNRALGTAEVARVHEGATIGPSQECRGVPRAQDRTPIYSSRPVGGYTPRLAEVPAWQGGFQALPRVQGELRLTSMGSLSSLLLRAPIAAGSRDTEARSRKDGRSAPLGVLLVDEPGSDGPQLVAHKSSSGEGADRVLAHSCSSRPRQSPRPRVVDLVSEATCVRAGRQRAASHAEAYGRLTTCATPGSARPASSARYASMSASPPLRRSMRRVRSATGANAAQAAG
jgi:hypothetical protein